jgi:hypothetical protein
MQAMLILTFLVSAQAQTVVYNNGAPTDTLPFGPGNNIAYFIGAEDSP